MKQGEVREGKRGGGGGVCVWGGGWERWGEREGGRRGKEGGREGGLIERALGLGAAC